MSLGEKVELQTRLGVRPSFFWYGC